MDQSRCVLQHPSCDDALRVGALGPLLWHWENNSGGEVSVELSLDEVKELARKIGFEITVSSPVGVVSIWC